MIFLPVKWDEIGTKRMNFEKSHIDNKGFGGENLSINLGGSNPSGVTPLETTPFGVVLSLKEYTSTNFQ